MGDKPGPPQFWKSGLEGTQEAVRKIAQIVSQLQKGQGNNYRLVTLKEDETTTEVIIHFARPGMVAVFSAQDANSAAEIAAGTLFASVSQGKVTIAHASSATERKLGLALLG